MIGPDGNDNNLAYGNPVASFEVVIPEDTDDYKSVLNNIYVAYNYTGTIQLGVDSFKGVNGGAGSSQAVTWASDNEHVVVDKNNGTISINGLPDLEECTATITATAVAGGATSTAKVNIIRVAGYSVKLNGTLLSQNAAYEAEYKLDTPKSYTITVTPAFNFTEENVNITPDFSATVTASGNEFSYNGGTLSMVLDSNSNPVFTVKENETERTLKTTLTVAVSGMTRTYDIVFTDKSESPLEVALPNVSDYLYFLGNKNAIKLESLFKVKSGYSLSGDVSVKVVDIINSGEEETIVDVTLSNTIGLGKTLTLPTTFVGPVEIRVTAHGMTTSLYANVVDATNVTTYSELKNQNSVLLSDITMSNNSSYYLSNATLYGNGFTFDVRDGAYSGTGYGSNNYLVGISNANLDNVKIIGKVYTTYNITAAKDYNRATVLTSGDCRITNSYISNCAAPLRVGGVLYVENTTLKGGYFANIDFLNGQLTLKDVTTINQANLNDKADDGSTIVGFGIVIAYTSELSSTTITIEGSLTQYNHISDDMKFDNSYASAFANKIFSSDFAVLQYTDANNVKWVNTGIISMTETFAKANLNNGENPAGYTGLEASATVLTSTYKGFFWSVKPTQEALSVTPFEWKPEAQAPVIPKHSFEYPVKDGDKNYLAKVENDYCYYEEGKINISMDEGDTFEFDPAILTVTKNGHTLSYSVTMNGTDYTGKNISFNTSGDYAIVYTYIDTYNYVLNGEVIGTLDETYTKTIFVSVSVVEPDAKHAEFSFNGTTGIKTNIGDKTYISANVNATSNSWGAVTVNGQKVYYPIVSAYVKTETNQNERQVFFPVFEGVVTIIDYADGGKGAQVTYDGNTNTVANYPTNLTVAKGKYISAQGTSALDNSKFVLSDGTWTTGIQDIFLFSANKDLNPPPESVTAYNSELCYATGSQLALFKNSEPNSRNGMNYWTVQYKYQDNAGVSYYYYVGYYANCYQEKSSGGGCVTPDTLVTLADGTQKEIQYITYEDKLLVWDSFKGEYTVVPAAIIVNHGFDNWTVIELNFDDGTTVKLITAHAFLDADTNAWELINANNVQNYVGHSFVRADGDGYKTVKLISYNVYEEYTESYTLVSAGHYNFITENMFSLTNSFYGFVAGLEFGKNFTYDEEILQSDIQKYGLYTYETFSDYITEEQYIAFNGQFLKISVDKGYLDFNNIVSLIEEYLNK